MTEATVSAGYAGALLDFAISKGADREALLAQSGISAGDLMDQDNRIAFTRFVALMRAGKVLLDDPALGLHFGEAVDLHDFSIVGLIARSAETMAEAFAQVNRFGKLVVEVEGVGDGDRLQITPDEDGLWLTDTRHNPNDFPELTESTFARMICTHARDFGDVSFIKAVHVSHDAPAYAAEYERILNVPVTFSSDRNALLIDPVFLSIKLSPSRGYVFGSLSKHAEALLKDLERSKTVRGQVEGALIPILHTGDISMELIAEKLGQSRQTLYRKLKAEGVSFEKLLDELRHQMALHYLKGERASVYEVAYLVGFSHPNAFSRAFKRWTGLSPRAARQRG